MASDLKTKIANGKWIKVSGDALMTWFKVKDGDLTKLPIDKHTGMIVEIPDFVLDPPEKGPKYFSLWQLGRVQDTTYLYRFSDSLVGTVLDKPGGKPEFLGSETVEDMGPVPVDRDRWMKDDAAKEAKPEVPFEEAAVKVWDQVKHGNARGPVEKCVNMPDYVSVEDTGKGWKNPWGGVSGKQYLFHFADNSMVTVHQDPWDEIPEVVGVERA
eukprot:gnl/MRDRNA2_/MRDRNA2_142745_c0_seq1.p1 gnl/MRDRNA2_/MRDRNA2_142745_c0~~gnl/MRDRNA2_/MRDRNA2_142745_c0_seq1.p1  ORF type:complete len:213 (-),score=40.52 gnl/MRDRNA2_/MRDRNA2_142745_c0_seq1:181-819(-)